MTRSNAAISHLARHTHIYNTYICMYIMNTPPPTQRRPPRGSRISLRTGPPEVDLPRRRQEENEGSREKQQERARAEPALGTALARAVPAQPGSPPAGAAESCGHESCRASAPPWLGESPAVVGLVLNWE